MMICVVIKGPTFAEAYLQILKAIAFADLVELRLDCFKSLDVNALKHLRTQFTIPMIFTLRSHTHGGNYTQSESRRLQDICQLLELKPEYIDLENYVPASFIKDISSKVILSTHNFSETPKDLEEIYEEMQKIPAYFYKIAVTAQNSVDAMRLACFAKQKNRLIAISMGLFGQFSRIIGRVLGCPITYAALDNDNAVLGQLSAKTLVERYNYRFLNADTSFYGLIGNPIEQSISDETHNFVFKKCGLNSLYIKILVNPCELSEFMQFAKLLPFRGLSVTMPLKEYIIPFLDTIDSKALKINAINTLVLTDGKFSGYNTDGAGALNAIERQVKVKGKKIIIIGAGGAAKAIAYEAKLRGGIITIINRDEEKAIQLAERLHCLGKGLEEIPADYDVLINCTPHSLPIGEDCILANTVVMDITTKPMETLFIKEAIKKGCLIVYGYQMFVEQALGQFDLWFNADAELSKEVDEKKANSQLLEAIEPFIEDPRSHQ